MLVNRRAIRARWLLAAVAGGVLALGAPPTGPEPVPDAAGAQAAAVGLASDALPRPATPRATDAVAGGDAVSADGPARRPALGPAVRSPARVRAEGARLQLPSFLQRVTYRPTGPPTRIA